MRRNPPVAAPSACTARPLTEKINFPLKPASPVLCGLSVIHDVLSVKKPPTREGRTSIGKSAPGRTRTCGQALRRRLLYPLSYGGRMVASVAWSPRRVVRDLAGDKDRAPIALTPLLHLRGTMWRFGEANR